MSALIRHLMSLVLAVAHDPDEFALVHRCYAAEFWAGVRSEKTPGHPNYRAPPSPSMMAELVAGRALEVQSALETHGIEFLNHGAPGVRLRKTVS